MLNIFTKKNDNPQLPPGMAQPVRQPNFREYTDPTGEFGGKQLARSLWFAEHQVLLYRLLIGGLIVLSIFLWTWSLWRWMYYIAEIPVAARLEREIAQFPNHETNKARFGARPLGIGGTSIVESGVKKYDFISEVVNPNPRFVARFSYYYIVEGVPTPPQTGFLLPTEAKPLAFLGWEGVAEPGAVQLVIDNLAWRRVSNHAVPDVEAWQAERLGFEMSNFSFVPAGSPDGSSAHMIRFTLANKTAYSYAEPRFYVGLSSQGVVTALVPLGLGELRSLESKPIDLRSYAPSLSADSVVLYPLIDIYDSASYLAPDRE